MQSLKTNLFERTDLKMDMKVKAKGINSNEINNYATPLKLT